jgi:hypothetical protein
MWYVEYDPERSILEVRLSDHVGLDGLREAAAAHAAALEATGSSEFRVLLDLRGLFPMAAESVAMLGTMNRIAGEQQGFRGLVVLADSATVAMQQHHTRIRAGSHPKVEHITMDAAEARSLLGV